MGSVVGRLYMVNLTSAKSVEAIKETGYHRCGQGLYLQVSKSGSKSWLFRYKSPVTQKQREMGLGSLNFISLAEARSLALENKRLMLSGIDPLEEKKRIQIKAQLDEAQNLTFKEVAEACIKSKSHEWKNPKHKQQWYNTLDQYAFPIIGNIPTRDVSTNAVLQVLEPIWTNKSETASRVRQRIETIWDYAKARNYVTGENPARLKGHLESLLPKTSKIKRIKPFPALPYQEIASFISALQKQKGTSPLALEFLILTAARTIEVIGSKWKEIDLEDKVWTISADRMKAGKTHRVPLCGRAVQILKSINTNRNPNDFIFMGLKNNKGLSQNAMLALLKQMQRSDITAHGFRSTFRDWAAEEAYQFSNETVELALAHTIKNKAEAAYRRGDQLERRRTLMNEWERYISSLKSTKAMVL